MAMVTRIWGSISPYNDSVVVARPIYPTVTKTAQSISIRIEDSTTVNVFAS